MTEATVSQIITAVCYTLPPTIAALAALMQGRANNRQTTDQTKTIEASTNKIEASTNKITEKTSAIIQRTEQIHEQTNGNLTLLKAQLQAAMTKVNELEQQIISMAKPNSIKP